MFRTVSGRCKKLHLIAFNSHIVQSVAYFCPKQLHNQGLTCLKFEAITVLV
ncbi:hypothetical protein WN55_03118 [Dufourea novaeangliae]|uniref:Uncharacterized protein n=1 Tax=Dufourea novaeangliae TaxID=178035 RepID=A0A154PL78_DUFNO|nr:hypothetical protein WN55_03118 [Dufourea novaeangliae]